MRAVIHAGVWSTDPDPESVARVVAAAAETGFDGLALPLRDPALMKPAALAKVFEHAGLLALGTVGLPPGADISSPERDQRSRGEAHLAQVIEVARDVGIVQIGGVLYGPLGHASTPGTDDARRRSAEVIGRVAQKAAAEGIRLCVEIVNRYESALMNTVEQGLDYLERVSHPNVRLHLDTYHLAIEERDPAAAVRRALPALGYFELDQSHRGRLDEGTLDLRGIAAPLRESGYDGLVGVEAFARSRLAPGHADALAIWRDHFEDGTALARQAIELIHDIFSSV